MRLLPAMTSTGSSVPAECEMVGGRNRQRGPRSKRFDERYQKSMPAMGGAQQVDYRLIGSGLSRVHWELEVNPRWKRDPNFYNRTNSYPDCGGG